MISDEERREVAATMRIISGEGVRNLTLGEILNSILTGGAPRPTTEMAILARLADLIDRPTCELVEVWDDERMEHYLDCTACRFGRLAIELDDEGKRFNSRALWASVDYTALTHCPYCGADVVR